MAHGLSGWCKIPQCSHRLARRPEFTRGRGNGGVDPPPRGLRLATTGGEHRHGGVIGTDHAGQNQNPHNPNHQHNPDRNRKGGAKVGMSQSSKRLTFVTAA